VIVKYSDTMLCNVTDTISPVVT